MYRCLLPASVLLIGLTSACLAQQPPTATEEHKLLAREVGVWDATMTMWMAPGTEPMTSAAVETNTMFGPFWLFSEFTCNSPAMPFKGRMQLGYDPVDKKYVGMWVDTMSPFPSASKGTYNAETHTLTLVSTACDIQTGEMKTSTMVSHFVDDDTKTFAIYSGSPGPDGKPAADAWKMMKIEYTRRK